MESSRPECLRVLVADDEQPILDAYQQILAVDETRDRDAKLDDLAAKLFSKQPASRAKDSVDLVCCAQAPDAVEAVKSALAEDRPYAVAFLDVRMPPGPDGVWAAEQIRAIDPFIQIVFVTAYSDIDPQEISQRIPPADKLLYIQKPFHPQEVRQFVTALGTKWHAERELVRTNERLEERVRERTRDLERAYEQLRELDRLKDNFVSSVSHELRTPLTSICSFADILQGYDEIDAKDREEFIGIICSESRRLTRLVNDLLDLSRFQSGMMVWRDEPLSLAEIIREVVRAQHPGLEKKSLRLNLELPEDLPSVLADPDRIQQVITNLLNNAVNFSHPGDPIHIKAETFESREPGARHVWIHVSVSDQGVGIEEEDLASIFDSFNQGSGDTLTDKPKGAGLGLSISREIVVHYGGDFRVESRKGEGSTFTFTLPAQASMESSLMEASNG